MKSGAPEFRFLTTLSACLGEAQLLGETPVGERKIAPVIGGNMEGARLSGVILPGGGDWACTTKDAVLHLDVRLTAQTHDGALIYIQYKGVRHGPEKIIAGMARGETVDPREIYFRIQPTFETADRRYAWLNRILTVGLGERLPEGPRYQIYELL